MKVYECVIKNSGYANRVGLAKARTKQFIELQINRVNDCLVFVISTIRS